MHITFFGAAGEVTGSCYRVSTSEWQVLIDCGMFQGSDDDERRNQVPHELDIATLDAVILTHAHLDHSGRLPLLVQHGYRGPIYATAPTIDVAELLLKDAAKLQADAIERRNRQRQRAARPLLSALFSDSDVHELMPLMRPVPYQTPTAILPGLSIELADAGHILGSASVIMTIDEAGERRIVVFSGDLGPRDAPIINDPASISQADLVVLESTYGDRNHRGQAETLAEFSALINHAVSRKGTILVPAFAVGRTQEILYHLGALMRDGTIPTIPVYLDSPMALAATALYQRYADLADSETQQISGPHKRWYGVPTLHPCPTAAESRSLNDRRGPKIIIAGSGMCNGGRITHHFKHNLWRPETTVLIVGYQARGTLGRLLVEGAKRVSIFDEEIAVKASIHTLGGFSAHAGQLELLAWLEAMVPCRPQVILTHGEDPARIALAECIARRFGLVAALPLLNDRIRPRAMRA